MNLRSLENSGHAVRFRVVQAPDKCVSRKLQPIDYCWEEEGIPLEKASVSPYLVSSKWDDAVH